MIPFVLLGANLLFVSFFGLHCLIWALMLSLFSFFIGKGVCGEKSRKIFLILGILVNILTLGTFKYSSSVGVNISIVIPIGMSFYSFRNISYLIDLYREKNGEYNLVNYLNYALFFPSFASGPIDRYADLIPQLKSSKVFNYEQVSKGILLFLWGLFKKNVVSGHMDYYTGWVYSSLESYHGFTLVLVSLLYTMQIYCDFSGYSDMAIGIANMLGINLKKNFSSPYQSISVTEFWHRWHISLSTWLRDYVYIPLGGNRCSKIRNYCNLMITFLVSGLWHGSTINFLCWGFAHGVAQVVEKISGINRVKNKVINVARWMVTFLFINFSWVLFRLESFRDISYFFSHMFDGASQPITYLLEPQYTLHIDAMTFFRLVLIVVIVLLFDFIELKVSLVDKMMYSSTIGRIACFAGLIIVIFLLNPVAPATEYIYFQF